MSRNNYISNTDKNVPNFYLHDSQVVARLNESLYCVFRIKWRIRVIIKNMIAFYFSLKKMIGFFSKSQFKLPYCDFFFF